MAETNNTNAERRVEPERRRVGILFLGGAKRVSMGQKFIDAGRRLGVDVELYDYELTPYVPLASIGRVIVGRKWKDADLYEHLHACVEKSGISIMVPFVDGAVEVAARYRDIYRDLFVPVGEPSGAAAMFDKIVADRIFRSNGLPVPRSDRFPMIAKPRCGSASKGIRIVHSPIELTSLEISTDRYLLQEYIVDRWEITVDCYVAADGRIISAVPRYRLEVQGGEVSTTRVFADADVDALVRKTLRATGLRGAVTVQLLKDNATGRLLIMEINPRLGGGAVASVLAGADLPEMILRDAMKLPIEPVTKWNDRLLVTRYFAEVGFNVDSEP